MSTTSIGRGPASGGNENHEGDARHKTMGEEVGQERPAGSEVPELVPGVTPNQQDKPRPAAVVAPTN